MGIKAFCYCGRLGTISNGQLVCPFHKIDATMVASMKNWIAEEVSMTVHRMMPFATDGVVAYIQKQEELHNGQEQR